MAPPLSEVLSRWSSTDKRRTFVLIMSIVVGLASGANYGYSAYAPQLASQLGLSSTQVNLVGAAGNLGAYITGPVWGKFVDARGQKWPLLLGGVNMILGYGSVHAFFVHTFPIRPSPSDPPSQISLAFLGLAMFLTGSGSCAGLTAAMNAIAKSYPDKTRASATGLVLAGYGLSAFLFSTLGHLLFGSDAGGLLLLLALGTGGAMIMGSLTVRPVPPLIEVDREGYEPVLGGSEEGLVVAEGYGRISGEISRPTSVHRIRSRSPTRGRRDHPHTRTHFPDDLTDESTNAKHIRDSLLASLPPSTTTYSPFELIVTMDFYMLFTILSLLCGTGLMYINNVGAVALALAREGRMEYDPHDVGTWQAKQVATISVWNCIGRIVGGLFSDFCKTRFYIRRVWCLPLVACMFIASQVAALRTTDVHHLWVVSTMLGFAYGSLFNVLPMLVLEWFGMSHFSQNWGWTCMAPVLGGNLFNLIFGSVYDSNSIHRTSSPVIHDSVSGLGRLLSRRAGEARGESGHDCLVGAVCYATAFKATIAGCLVALVLSIAAGMRRETLA